MPTILLIRHGENEYTRTGRMAGRLPDVHLNEKGRAQAATLAERLKGAPIKAIYSSPMERALETAAPLAETLKLDIRPRPGLIEINIGDWQGQKVKSMTRLKIWRQVQISPSLTVFPGGESFADAQHRICAELMAIAAQHGDKDLVACFSHADPIKLAVAYFLGMPLDAFQRLTISTASITTLYLGEGASRLLSINVDLSFTFQKP